MYASSAKKDMTAQDLEKILAQSQTNNAPLGITGLLLYHDGNFIQVLEGPEDAVRKVYNRIVQDDRHGNLHLLVARLAQTRLFPDWAMGYKRVTDVPQEDQAAFRDFFNDTFTDPAFFQKPDRVIILLKAFVQATQSR